MKYYITLISCPLCLNQKECSKEEYIIPPSPMASNAALSSSSRFSLSKAEPTSELISSASGWSSIWVKALITSDLLPLFANSSICCTRSLLGGVSLAGSSLIYVSNKLLNFFIFNNQTIYFCNLYKDFICNILIELVQPLFQYIFGDVLALIGIDIDNTKLSLLS